MNEENEQIKLRREKLTSLRESGDAYPNDFRRDWLAAALHKKFDDETKLSTCTEKYKSRRQINVATGDG